MLIHLICAARPNFMKIAPLYHALKGKKWANPVIVHTGQHYDLDMSDIFFRELQLPEPNIHLGVGSGTHAEQTGKVMIAYERVLFETQPDLVVVVGDVNSTMACTIAATKLTYPKRESSTVYHKLWKRPLVAHLEAGLRSFDRTMPEEVNRLVTDALADILWTPSLDADENLTKEGIPSKKIHRVGNIMIDSLEMLRGKIEQENVFKEMGLELHKYGLVTIHRPSNVDDPEKLKRICNLLTVISKKIPLIFPVHPRTRKNLKKYGLLKKLEGRQNLFLPGPLSYVRFMNLVFNCRLVITDSGGIQEETTYLGVPCLTLRSNTERPITVTEGTNQLCTLENLESKVAAILNGKRMRPAKIQYWDGKTADRIVQYLQQVLAKS